MLEQALVRRYQTIEDVLQDLDLPKKSPISVPISSQPVPSMTTPPAVKLTTPTFTSTSGNSLVLDCGNGVKLELVKVAAGSFDMGSNEDNDEKPIHRVNLREFLIGKYPVTQAQYQAVTGKNPSKFKGDQNPVEKVSWDDAVKFCEGLSKKIGQKVKLPTEAQWEYACRAGSTGKYCFGDNYGKSNDYGWFRNNTNKTHPVGEKLSNSWGLHDMHGNVWEWCEDDWHDKYNGAPNDGSAWIIRNKNIFWHSELRVIRGGSWSSFTSNCGSASRGSHHPSNGFSYIGFRVVI
jgi:formylglycine-generating enzyme required for sulfatase activity